MIRTKREFFRTNADAFDGELRLAEVGERLRQIIDALGITPDDKVLDIGCGGGVIERILQGRCHLMAVDIVPEMLTQCKLDGCFPVAAKALALPFANETFDWVIIFSAFPHLGEPSNVMECVRDVLVPNGRLLILHLASHKEINKHHRDVKAEAVSFNLLPIEELTSLAQNMSFNVILAKESDKMYYLLSETKIV